MVSDQALSAISGAVGGVVALVATYPLLTISTRLAVQKAKTTDGYTSTLDTFLKIVQQEGWTTLYAGMKSAIFGTAATYGVFYYFYRLCRDFHLRRNDSRPLSTAVSLLVGSEAGAVTAVSTNPIWVVTTMLQANRKQASGAAGAAGSGEAAMPTSALEVAKYIVDTEGIKGFFKGVIPALILVINPAVQYMVFEKVKEFYCAKTGRKQLTSLQVFLLGAIAKLAATFVTYPYIVVKTRLQAQKQGASDYYHGTTDVLAKIWHEEGFLGFYKGLNSKITQSVLNASLLFMVQDYINNVCKGLLADTKAVKA